MKKTVLLMATFLISISLIVVGCGKNTASTKQSSNNESKTITLKLGHHGSEKTPFHLGGQKFADLVSERTKGAVKIELYPNSTLGGALDLIDGQKMGTVDMVLSPTAALANSYKPLDVFYLPFLFNNREEVYKIADGNVGKDIFDDLEAKHGIKTLGFFDSGFRTITNSVREIKEPKDVAGLKLRVPETQVVSDAFQQLGAICTPMAMGELFTALQQKTVDGQDNPIGNVYSSSYYEVQPYMTLTNHSYAGILLTISDKSWDKIPDKYKPIIEQSAKDAAEWEREYAEKADQEYLEKMKSSGVKVTELTPEQSKMFQDAMKPVWDKYKDSIGQDLINKVMANK